MTTAENLGAAERIIQAITTHADHLYHGRPGMVVNDERSVIGVKWFPGTVKEEEGHKVFYRQDKSGKKTVLTKIGNVWQDGTIRNGSRHKLARFQAPGVFPEAVSWTYKQVADVWELDNELAAKWASYMFGRTDTHRDLLNVLAGFLLVQSRFGEPIKDDQTGTVFYDEDYREVGEAVCLIYSKSRKGLDPKQLLRVRDILLLPEVAKINRDLGFGKSARTAPLGRWNKAVTQWLRYRETNQALLDGLVKAGFRTSVMRLCQHVGYKPQTPKFFETLRWKQKQSDDGRREIFDVTVAAVETWDNLSEEQICERIVGERINFKQVVGKIPESIGLTRAIMAASIEAGGLSMKDLVTYTPTLESLGLLEIKEIKDKWDEAIRQAQDQRSAHVAQRVRSKEVKEQLETAADNAVRNAVEEVLRGLRVYVVVDRSGSMTGAIEAAKTLVTKILGGFPLESLHVSVFNTYGQIVNIRNSSRAGVVNAFRGIGASGGTSYGTGVTVFGRHGLLPKDGEDAIILFVGDEEQYNTFSRDVRASGINPAAFGLIHVVSDYHAAHGVGAAHHRNRHKVVRLTAAELGIPCFEITPETFDDAYAVPRVLRNLIESTPVGVSNLQTPVRKSLVETILETELLQKPAWAA